jgi:hypothetical protein
MKISQINYAIRKAHESFDRWNDCTGLITKFCGYYEEALAEIETAVRIGARVALGLKIRFDEDGQLIDDGERETEE